ncbi:MAG TPA: hypothetical protein VG709_05005, partial [Actinomycetota bacterium]|nr:hypothetical protein [Actinomycetota bacterium]
MTGMRTAWSAIAVAAALAVGAVAGGCGGGDDVSPQAAVADAATKTADAGTSRLALEVETELPGEEPVAFTGTGVFDYDAQRGRMAMDMSELLE